MDKADNIKKLLGLIHSQDDFIEEYSKHFKTPPLEIGSTSTRLQDETIVFLQNYIKNQKLNLKN